jgi:integrase
MGRTKSIGEIVPFWLEACRLERGRFAFSNNQRWIKRFIHGLAAEGEAAAWEGMGRTEAANCGPKELLAYRSALASRYQPSTVNLYLMTAKRLVQWAAENEFRKPVMLTGVRCLQDSEEKESKVWTPEQVQHYLSKALRFNRQVFCWCAIQYLGLMRPSECLTLVLAHHRVAGHKAEKVAEGVYKTWGKTSYRSGLPRYLIVPPEAEALLAETEPCWSSWRTYWQGANTAMGVGPHRFRHSSLAHLQAILGPEQISTVELISGHYQHFKVLIKHYAPPDWSALRKYGSKLVASIPTMTVEGSATAAA